MFRKQKKAISLKKTANYLYSMGDFGEAKIKYKKALEKEPNDTDLMIQLASIYFAEEQWFPCESLLVKADEIRPNDDVTLQNLGALYIQLQKWEKANRYLQQAIVLNPKNAHAWNNLGLIQKEIKELEEAERSFTKAIETDPNDFEYVFNLGELFEAQHNYEEAKDLFGKLLEQDTENQELLGQKLRTLTEIIQKERIDRLKKTLQVSTKLRLDRLQEGLNMSGLEFNRKIVDWAFEFGFTIEGEYLLVNKSTVSDFLVTLDENFNEWTENSKKKAGKL
ncbi:Beta-barrel assembly-enhancing protease [Candidatus Lokiarchaeum ossiferum]|uniref:Beta-barrel assembly-enhancing protease n=1 Tax=Candidatus Lokiarchaeum ossiferum TaxID=2951803 RepID=A0ABY6HVM8_9ARCH|nr:Beta-barrel assembly-enhancing protease [Candidatus Lokiarchaeum sp. B-35]